MIHLNVLDSFESVPDLETDIIVRGLFHCLWFIRQNMRFDQMLSYSIQSVQAAKKKC